MKRLKTLITVILVLFIITFINASVVKAKVQDSGVPYKTYTVFDQELREVQTAYLPLGVLNHDYVLNNPSDLFIKGNYLYVSNMSSKNIVIFDLNGKFVKSIGDDFLQMPMGVFVDDDDFIYVADKEAQRIYKLDFDGDIIEIFSRPSEALFGEEAAFKPEKVVVDRRGNLFITGEGSVNGIIQLNRYGNFLGYFGVNQTKYDWRMIFTNMMDLKGVLARNLPPAPNNLAIDNKGLIYTITPTISPSIKKFNLASNVMLSCRVYLENEQVQDIWVDEYHNIFVVTDMGLIYQYDAFGNLLFVFGGLDKGERRLGLIGVASAIATDDNGNIYILDKNYNNIQIYNRTNFSQLIHEATELYRNGNIEASQVLWESVKDLNVSYGLANSILGRIYLKQGNYEEALDAFYLAKDRGGYSEAYWEIRNLWLTENSEKIFITIFALILLSIIFYIFKFKEKINGVISNRLNKIKKVRIVNDLLMTFSIIRHPLDSFYYIKKDIRGSYKASHFLYGLLFVVVILSYLITSFIFNLKDPNNISLLLEFVIVIGFLILFVISNYLVSTLLDGEGRFKDVYIGTIYSLSPIIIFLIPLSILTNVLTYNEIFIFSLGRFVIYGYSIILIFVMIKEIHGHRFGETLKNIILTIFTMIIISLLGFIVYLLLNQLVDFIISIIKEMIIRVTN